ncbi:MAG: hypothetical protein EHM14_12340 [Methanothrix sp.]|nr:MAG: hypothetical protein EHM14_12340 [Methanothrix sp.]
MIEDNFADFRIRLTASSWRPIAITAAEVAGRIPLVELRDNYAKRTDHADKSCLEIIAQQNAGFGMFCGKGLNTMKITFLLLILCRTSSYLNETAQEIHPLIPTPEPFHPLFPIPNNNKNI